MVTPVSPLSPRRRGVASRYCRLGPRLFFFLGLIGMFLQVYFLLHHKDAPKVRPRDNRPSKNIPQRKGKIRKGENSTNHLAKAMERVRKGSAGGLPPPMLHTDEVPELADEPEPVIEETAKQAKPEVIKDITPMVNTTKAQSPKGEKPAKPLVPLPIIKEKNGYQIGYAVSLVKCGDFQSSSAGLIDASLVMRHSIHLTHLQSKYDYKMYAIVHKQAEECSHVLKDVGFEIVLVDPPVNATDIRGEYLREYIHKEWCCGEHEFVKLFAYTLPDPVIVHVDIDFAFMRPMDDLFDAIIFDKDTPEGKAARSKIPLERPSEGFPDQIDAFITRDWPQVVPGRLPLYQAGFLVARRKPEVMKEVVNVVLEGNYSKGYGRENGWGNKGYGGLVGAMAMQGLMAYYYDIIRPGTAVELNQCRFNHMGMDVLYRHAPNFRRKHPKVGQCRNDLDYCEDCTLTKFELIHNVHYTQCRKPWNCIGVGFPGGKTPDAKKKHIRANAIDTDAGNFDHCMELVTQWHHIRTDFESKLFSLTNDPLIQEGHTGKHMVEYFQGHCMEEGGHNYLSINASVASMRRVPELYH